jgi:N-acetylneuraminic acid mutarotase
MRSKTWRLYAAFPLMLIVGGCDRDAATALSPTVDAKRHRDAGRRECTIPPARGYSRMIYDDKSKQVFLFGGFSTLGFAMDILDVWSFDTRRERWQPIGEFLPQDYDALAFDSRSRKVIVFQPFVPDDVTTWRIETWAFDVDTRTWENRHPAGEQPPSRWGSRMAYDAESDRVVLFGGSDIFTEHPLGDTWAYDYESNAWTNLQPQTSAPPHHFHDMVYHEGADRIVLFGGFARDGDDFFTLGDTWVFDLNSNTWTELHPSVSPAPRGYAMLAYESKSEKIVMYGGILEEIDWPNEPTMDETWVFDLDRVSWKQLSPRRSAGDRGWHQMVGIGKEVLLFGGGPSRFKYDNRAYTFHSRSNRWQPVRACGGNERDDDDDDDDDDDRDDDDDD